MQYVLRFSKSGKKDFEKLDIVTRKRIKLKIEFYMAQPDPVAHAKALVNHQDAEYRWRVGKYRVTFDIVDKSIVILRIDKRSDIYRMFVI